MDLREMVRDYRPALDYFFIVKQQGFFIDEENFEVSTLVPKELPHHESRSIQTTTKSLTYVPPDKPTSGIVSRVRVRNETNDKSICKKLRETDRAELIPAVMWLLERRGQEVEFFFRPSGKLQLRDTSTYPIQGIETWSSWLREELFGPGIDLDAAYIQFLLKKIDEAYEGNSSLVSTMFPDLVRLLHDKEEFRREICVNVLGLSYDKKGKALVKKIIMSLANGSKISPALLTNGTGFSLTAEIVINSVNDAPASRLSKIGERLQAISTQFARAKKIACLASGVSPNRANVKKIFSSYFAWEREARYALWEAVDRHGIMVHDGIDGVPDVYRENISAIVNKLQLQLTV